MVYARKYFCGDGVGRKFCGFDPASRTRMLSRREEKRRARYGRGSSGRRGGRLARRSLMPRLTLALVLLVALTPPAFAAAAPTDSQTLLHLSERAERPVVRDELRAVLRVDASDSDAARLEAEINRRMAEAVARAKGVAGIKIFTSGYSVYQQQLKDQPAQWHGTASLTLTARDASTLLKLAGELQQSGLLMSSLAFEVTPEAARGVEDELTSEALLRLRARAQRVAADLGMAVVRIRDISVGNASGLQPVPRFFNAASAAAATPAAAPPPVAEPGEATVSVFVNAEIEIAPKH
jgi:predicted secreted protein